MESYQYVKDCWYVAGLSHEFKPETLTGHKIAGQPLVIWRTRTGKVVAFDNRCCHKRFPLSEGRLLENGLLECAYHGLCYDEQGRCVKIPSHPDGHIPPQARLRPFPVIEQDGLVWVWTGNPERAALFQPPRTPEVADPAWESIDSGPMHVPANYLLLIENLLDITHFYPLHDGNIGDYANSLLPIELVEGEIGGYRFVKTIRRASNYVQPPYFVDWFHYEVVDREHTHCMLSPGLTRVELRVAPPGKLGTGMDRGYVLLHTHTPVDDRNHVWRWCVNCRADHMSRGDPARSAARRIAEMFPDVVAQDRWALEKQQQMFDYPDDGYSELFLKSDKALRRARQVLAQMQHEEILAVKGKAAASSMGAPALTKQG
ncbi:MAG: aromatic ring-hydroxylating dioxygenase subunit alpha [Pseudomonadota bacterium]|jgi:vanillate O-demethylase monooxygenase subunit